ncbi:glycosyltransferase family 2 protein [Christiangramia salexigens]|uniref:Glycosyl transferase n=1 Tax=Christiangramia salexigens TaxID=1913577 RepID=A0A1L3J4S3_9FLAO|nr:glycosyltransferase family A protein [Christiangramia salexigens]APG60112.1 glycosyl transferase [Christiangramia salexigens]
MFKPLVSVIIPCYNDHLYINEALMSIKRQDYENLEVIIVDDGSNFKTKKVLRELKEDKVKILTQDNAGPASARNQGISAANGDYIVTLDADDYFEPEFIKKAISILMDFPHIGLVTSYAYIFSEKGVEFKVTPSGGKSGDFLIKNSALASCMFRKECWESVSGYDENLTKGYEDWDFNISITKSGWQVEVIKEFLFNYRLKTNSRNQIADELHKYKLLEYIYLKHRDVFLDNCERMIVHLVSEMEYLEKKQLLVKKTFTFKLGKFLLAPFKRIKQLWKFENIT